jgi:hypothetical protein
MMGKNSTTSQLDFLLLEEVSNEAAESISGGKTLTLEGAQALEFGLFDMFTMPFDALTAMIGSISGLAGALGLTLPALPTPDLSAITSSLPDLPDPETILPS